MKPLSVFVLIISVMAVGCASQSKRVTTPSLTRIDTLFAGKASIRSLAVSPSKLWFGADNGRVGEIDLATRKTTIHPVDTLTSELRSIAITQDAVFVLNAGTPATLYRLDLASGRPECVYSEYGPDVFYDSMVFAAAGSGIAIGDPSHGCPSVIRTSDGGRVWKKINCAELPEMRPGEAAFASSNTCVAAKGPRIWIATGGRKSRVLYSADNGKTWTFAETPIRQGETMTGIFSMAFADEKTGMIAGGHYEKPTENTANKAITRDGGKTWTSVADGTGPGYISCIQPIPSRNGKSWVSVGATGVHRSDDFGATWTQLSACPGFYTLIFHSEKVAYAAGRNLVVRLTFSD